MSRLTRTVLCITALAVLWLALPLTSRAGTITVYSNFGPGNAYDPNDGYTQSGAGSLTGFNALQAMAFTNTTGENIALTQIDIADSFVAGNNTMTLNLYADTGGAPGAVLESWTVNNLPGLGTCCTVETVNDVAGVILQNGGTYWLAPASDDVTWEAWNWNTTGASGNGSFSADGGTTWATSTYNPNGAFDVLGTSVSTPEPASLLMLGAGMLGLVGVRRKERQA
jgi:PEP-CTERM motif-containing protein